jgi:micrococcal nuclease
MGDRLRLLALLALLLAGPAAAAPPGLRVIDGDTVEHEDVHHRLLGFDAPETHGADCPAEAALGRRATARLRELLAGARRIVLTPSGRRDRYGRELSTLTVDGRDVGETLIHEGLARLYDGGRRRPWC